jgi:hypothetical protein
METSGICSFCLSIHNILVDAIIVHNRGFIDSEDDEVDNSQSEGGEDGSIDEIVAWENIDSSRTVIDNVDEEVEESSSESENDEDPAQDQGQDHRNPSSPLYRNDSRPSKRDRKREERVHNLSSATTALDEDNDKPLLRLSRNSSSLQTSHRIVTSRSSNAQQVDKRRKRKRYLEVSDEEEEFT